MEELRKLLEKYMNQDLERLILSSPRKGQGRAEGQAPPCASERQVEVSGGDF